MTSEESHNDALALGFSNFLNGDPSSQK